MIFRELSNAVFRFVLRCAGAEIDGGGGCSNTPPSGGGKSRGPAGRGLTRALLGGGAFERPLKFFEDSENTAARSATGFSPTLPMFSVAFVKIST